MSEVEKQIRACSKLSEEDRKLLRDVAAGLPLTSDVARADVLLCCQLSVEKALVILHAAPGSVASLYRNSISDTQVNRVEQPVVMRVLAGGRGGRMEREVRDSRAPVIQDVYPVYNNYGVVIAALAIEFNMLTYERHRGRSRVFQDALRTLINMCAYGQLQSADQLSRFGLYDGMYLVDRNRIIQYMSSVADNLYRSAGVTIDAVGQPLSELESADAKVTDHVFESGKCIEFREERPSGRIWIRKGIPIIPSVGQHSNGGIRSTWQSLVRRQDPGGVDSVLVLMHNATENVQKQRELNVKSAIIREVHHRVKNNLQSVAAILRIQARRAEHEETKQALTDAVNRILSIAVIHEFLGEGEERLINIRDLADRVASQVGQVTNNPEQEVSIRVNGPQIRLPAGQATPVAMVINELVLNGLEHGLQGYAKGYIEVNLEDLGRSVRVTVTNSGSGLPPDFNSKQSGSLGLQIVNTLVTDDLKGEMILESLVDSQRDDLRDDSFQEIDRQAGDSDKSGDDVGRSRDDDCDFEFTTGAQAIVTFPKRSLKVD